MSDPIKEIISEYGRLAKIHGRPNIRSVLGDINPQTEGGLKLLANDLRSRLSKKEEGKMSEAVMKKKEVDATLSKPYLMYCANSTRPIMTGPMTDPMADWQQASAWIPHNAKNVKVVYEVEDEPIEPPNKLLRESEG